MNTLWQWMLTNTLAQTGATGPTGTAGAVAAPPPVEGKTLLDYLADAGSIGYLLVLLSVVALALTIANFIRLRRSKLAPPGVVASLDGMLRAGDIDAARAFSAHPDNRNFVTNVIGSALARSEKSPFGLLEFRSAMEDAGQAETDKLHRMTDGLGIIAAVGPMLGLLGTVIGMIGAFQSIGQMQGAQRSSELAKFMSMALVNTAEGLIVAIPCTVLFAYFRRRIDALSAEAAAITEDLAGHLEGRATSAERHPSRPARPGAVPRGVAEATQGVQVT